MSHPKARHFSPFQLHGNRGSYNMIRTNGSSTLLTRAVGALLKLGMHRTTCHIKEDLMGKALPCWYTFDYLQMFDSADIKQTHPTQYLDSCWEPLLQMHNVLIEVLDKAL